MRYILQYLCYLYYTFVSQPRMLESARMFTLTCRAARVARASINRALPLGSAAVFVVRMR